MLDARALPAEAARKLAELVAAAKAVADAETSGPGRIRDGMGYTITVEDDGQSTLLRGSDAAMSPAFADLLGWLEQRSEAR